MTITTKNTISLFVYKSNMQSIYRQHGFAHSQLSQASIHPSIHLCSYPLGGQKHPLVVEEDVGLVAEIAGEWGGKVAF